MALASELSYIKKLLRKKLEEAENAFSRKHYGDSDEQLLAYLRQCAAELGGTVYNGNSIYNFDITGTRLLKERFGNNWDNILAMAGLPKISPQERLLTGCLYSREIKRLSWCVDKTREALAEQEQAFLEKYRDAGDEAILEYLREAAARLGYTPASADVAGRKHISGRFGSWAEAIRQAGLPKVKRKYKIPEDGALFMTEFWRQEAIYAEHLRRLVRGELDDASVIATDKMVKKQKKAANLEERAQALAGRMLIFKEKLFAVEYAKADNRLLLDYLSECIRELGHLPHKSEVIGGEFIAKRFGGWETAVRLAICRNDIDFPEEPEPEPEERLIYAREVQIQKYLLEGRETVVRMLYKSPLVCRMQAGNVFHILRWNPAAANSADSQCYGMVREQFEKSGRKIPMSKQEMETEAAKFRTVYNRTLDALDLQTRKFEVEHKNDGKKELLAYVRQRGAELHTTPELLDVVGAEFVMRRLDCTWGMILTKIRMKKNGAAHKIYQSKLFKAEFRRQMRLWEDEAAAESTENVV